MLELGLTILFLIGLFFWNREFSRTRGFSPVSEALLQISCCFHMMFAGIFTYYLQKNGGDAIRYWAMTADLSQDPVGWGDYWGHGTFFLQWLNFWPAKYLGLDFWFGNVMYAGISWIGIREITALMLPYLRSVENRFFLAGGWLILLLPNLHFWSAGVGKEAFLVFGMAYVIKGLDSPKSNWHFGLGGLLMAFWVRPAFGIVLGLVFFLFLVTSQDLTRRMKTVALILGSILGALGIWKLAIMMHLNGISWSEINNFSSSQLEFLSGFGAGSEIPMASYNWLERFWAVFFRPGLFESTGFWENAAALENLLGLALTFFALLAIVPVFGKSIHWSVPRFILAAGLVVIGASVVFGLSLNNLGIIMRMKSTFFIYWYLLAWMVIASRVRGLQSTGKKD